MSSLRRYINSKLGAEEFGCLYRDFCEVCPATVRIVNRLSELNIPAGSLAQAIGAAEDDILAFMDGDRCTFAIASRLGERVGVRIERCRRNLHSAGDGSSF